MAIHTVVKQISGITRPSYLSGSRGRPTSYLYGCRKYSHGV